MKTTRCLSSLLLATLILTGCATTRPIAVWESQEPGQPASSVLVLGIHDELTLRRLYEDKLVERLTTTGTEAISAAAIMPVDTELKRETIAEVVKEKGVDAVLVTRLVKREKETSYMPGTIYTPPHDYYHDFYGYYAHSYPIVQTPGYIVTDTVVTLETNFYNTDNAKLVWSMRTETFNPDTVEKVVDELTEMIVSNLTKSGMI